LIRLQIATLGNAKNTKRKPKSAKKNTGRFL
jgi:hypothetical protein